MPQGPVNQHLHRRPEAEMANTAVESLLDTRLPAQPIPIDPSLEAVGVDRKKRDPEAGQIVEEVRTE